MTKTASPFPAAVKNAVKIYLDELTRQYATGNATEHSYRPALKDFIAALLPNLTVINEPKRIKCGAPDYILQKNDLPIAFIEAKDIGDTDLVGKKQNKEQFDRYKASLNNLLFTDYLVFHFYQNGELVEKITLAETSGKKIILVKEKESTEKENLEKFAALLEKFGQAAPQAISTAKDLAAIMAGKARLLAGTIENALADDTSSGLSKQMAAFRKVLIHDLEAPMFADIYAQTIVYGMFAARLHTTDTRNFSRLAAAMLIPKTNPFLRKMFQYIAGFDLDDRIAWIVDDLVAAFKVADVGEVMAGYGKRTVQTDPFLHFYENFLAAYNPALRKERGVWYTPSAVVGYIVRAIDEILQRDFGLANGLANNAKVKKSVVVVDAQTKKESRETRDFHKVQILDPATGTGTFLAGVVQAIHAKMLRQRGAWQNYVTEHLLPRLHGFEILMAPYAMAHLKLEMLLAETGYRAETDQRLGIYLTNSLEEYHEEIGEMFYQELAEEANAASNIKRDAPVMVVLGNPPYNAISANKGEWIKQLMSSYKKEPNTNLPLKERNPKWINDDYCKFIRLGQEFVDRNSEGILAYITNHSFLDNPTFRGMRWQLLKSFDTIYIIDLHGNSKKKETAPDGSKDENVFDIQQGVSINLFIKTGKKKDGDLAEVYHCDLFGKREGKYTFLADNNLQSTPFTKLAPDEPLYFFVPRNTSDEAEYNCGFSVDELFFDNSVGIVTARDNFTIHHSAEGVKNTISEFLKLDNESARSKFKLGEDVRDWRVQYAREDLKKNYPNAEKIVKISYRPFDDRVTFYTGNSKGFHCYPRVEVMQHFLAGENIGLVIPRQAITDNWSHVQVSKHIVDNRIHYSNKGISIVCPLYLYPATDANFGDTSVAPNLKPEIVSAIAAKIGIPFDDESPVMACSPRDKKSPAKSFTPLDLFDYIYGVLHSPAYRERYKEFLKTDFPRVPYPNDAAEFWHFAKFGGELRRIHLLEHEKLDTLDTSYAVAGDNVVTGVKYVDGKISDKVGGKVYINATQYFGNVNQVAWDFYIGGYQPAQKWLKDRKNRTLSHNDIIHYQRILAALTLTAEMMREIDK